MEERPLMAAFEVRVLIERASPRGGSEKLISSVSSRGSEDPPIHHAWALPLLEHFRAAQREHNCLGQALGDCKIAVIEGKGLSGEDFEQANCIPLI